MAARSKRLEGAPERRYGLKPYRRHGQGRATVLLRVVPSFLDDLLWPEFNPLAEALREDLDEATERIIREAVFQGAAEPEDRQAGGPFSPFRGF